GELVLNGIVVANTRGDPIELYWGGPPKNMAPSENERIDDSKSDLNDELVQAARDRAAQLTGRSATEPISSDIGVPRGAAAERPTSGLFLAARSNGRLRAVNSAGMLLAEVPAGQFRTGARGTGNRMVTLSHSY